MDLILCTHCTLIDGDGFSADAGEAHLDLTICAWDGRDGIEVLSVGGLDRLTGAVYTREQIEARASERGREQLAEAIEQAIDRYQHSGRTVPAPLAGV